MLTSWIRTFVVVTACLWAQSSQAADQAAKPAVAVPPEPTNLLGGKQPVATSRVAGAQHLTNGIAAEEGDFWLTDHSAHLANANAYVLFDLGGPRLLMCGFVQGDNNDSYRVEGSVNGDKFFPLFVAPPVDGPGMRTRTQKLVGTARFIRIKGEGGDGSYSLSEVGVFHRCPDKWPPELRRVQGTPIETTAWILFACLGASLLVYAAVFRRRSHRGFKLVGAVPSLIIAVLLLRKLAVLYAIF